MCISYALTHFDLHKELRQGQVVELFTRPLAPTTQDQETRPDRRTRQTDHGPKKEEGRPRKKKNHLPTCAMWQADNGMRLWCGIAVVCVGF